ncbi:MAG: glycosyl transferase family 1 [Pirellulaceae bacterium]|nr:MAG: glycosyl transferase family 1 [Pirellulaceae bacterium]
MRIVQIIPTLDQAGAEKQMVLLASRLPRDRFDVHVCVLTRLGPLERQLKEAAIEVTLIGKRGKLDPVAMGRLYRYLVRLRPDLVHTWIFAANSYGRLAARWAGVPLIVAGERCVDRWKSGYQLAIDRYLARFTHRIATNSQGVVDFYVQHGLPQEKFVVIPNGIEVPRAAGSSREELLRELGLPSGIRLIGAAGRLWPQKRYPDMIVATDLLKVLRDDVHLLVFGDGPERVRLERLTEELRVNDRVHWLGHRSDLDRWLPHLDCFWNASGYEGQSNALMEAMAWGIPVVVSDIPGNRELVTDGRTGLVFPVGDRTQLAALTRRVLDDPEWARQLGQAARACMLREFSVEKMVERYIRLYESMAQG